MWGIIEERVQTTARITTGRLNVQIGLEPRRIAYNALGRRVSELRGALNGVSRLSLGKLEPGPRSHRQAISVGVTPTSEGIVQPGCATPFSSLIGLLQTVLNEKLAPSDIRC